MSAQIRVVTGDYRANLGESPVWNAGILYWVDIEERQICWMPTEGTTVQTVDLGERAGCICLHHSEDGFIAGIENRIAHVRLQPLEVKTLAVLPGDQAGYRCNDGKCDASGRFWVGTCRLSGERESASLYLLDSGGVLTQMASDFICVNGPAFSPDGRLMYCADSLRRVVWRYEISIDGSVRNRSIFQEFFESERGLPDGMTCDALGNLWVAHWGGRRVSRFDPAGKLCESIHLPVTQPTSCTFGGPGLRTLFITSASNGLAESANTLDGAVLAVDVPVPGIPTARYVPQAIASFARS